LEEVPNIMSTAAAFGSENHESLHFGGLDARLGYCHTIAPETALEAASGSSL